jgi:hypothetical protein
MRQELLTWSYFVTDAPDDDEADRLIGYPAYRLTDVLGVTAPAGKWDAKIYELYDLLRQHYGVTHVFTTTDIRTWYPTVRAGTLRNHLNGLHSEGLLEVVDHRSPFKYRLKELP